MDWWENTCQQWPHCWQGLEWLSERSSTLSPSLRMLSTSWEEEEPDFCFWSGGGEIESLWSTSTIPQSLHHQSIWLSSLWNDQSMTYLTNPQYSVDLVVETAMCPKFVYRKTASRWGGLCTLCTHDNLGSAHEKVALALLLKVDKIATMPWIGFSTTSFQQTSTIWVLGGNQPVVDGCGVL